MKKQQHVTYVHTERSGASPPDLVCVHRKGQKQVNHEGKYRFFQHYNHISQRKVLVL